MFETHTPNTTTVSGYVVMRLAMVAQWLRAAASDPERRAATPRASLCSRCRGSPRCWSLSSGSGRSSPSPRSSSPWPSGPSAPRQPLAPAAHRRALRPPHTHRAGRIHTGGHRRRPVCACVRRSAVCPRTAHRGRFADRVLDVVGLFRPPRPRSSHQPAAGDGLGLRPLQRPLPCPSRPVCCACGCCTTGRSTAGHDSTARLPRASCC